VRHGSKDRIVDLLLAAFPEAVNAKGKHDRTPLDCAIHGEDAIRGRILNTFVERTKAKATKVVVSQCSREVIQLKNKLKQKESELNEVRSTLNTLDAARTKVETELTEMINALKASQAEINENTNKKLKQLEESKETEERELQVKIEQLESEKRDLQAAEKSAKQEELEIRKALETVQMHVVQSTPSDDVQSMEAEVKSLQSYRIQHSISKAEIEVEALTGAADEGDGATKDDIKHMQKAISDLKKNSTMIKTDEDAKSMQAEIDNLRCTLLEKEHSSKIRMDLMRLKESLERDINDANLSETQVATIKAAIEPLDVEKLEEKSKDELKALKEGLLKLYIKLCVEGDNGRTGAANEKREGAEVAPPVVSQVVNQKSIDKPTKGKAGRAITRACGNSPTMPVN
jgi:myosin heavy subunit